MTDTKERLGPPTYTRLAVEAFEVACEMEPDFAGWVAEVLARTAVRLDADGHALVHRRPGSWEAECVIRLVDGTPPGAFPDESEDRDG